MTNNLPEGYSKADLVQRLNRKGYEIEGLTAEFNPLEAVSNVPSSLIEIGKNIYHAVKSPIQTIDALTDIAAGGVAKLIPDRFITEPEKLEQKQQLQDKFDQLIDLQIERYGSKDRILNTIEKDPAGFLGDLATVLGGAGAAIKATGTAGKIATVSRLGDRVVKFSRLLEPTTAALKISRGTNKLLGVNKAMRAASGRLMKKSLRISDPLEKSIAAKTGIKRSADWLSEHGISGSLEDMSKQLDDIQKRTKSIVDRELLRASDTNFVHTAGNANANIILQESNKILKRLGNKGVKYIQIKNAVDYLGEKNFTTGLNLYELNEVKRISDRIVKIYKDSGGLKATTIADNLGDVQTRLRRFIENEAGKKGFTDLRKLNRQTQISFAYKDHINNLLNVTEKKTSILRDVQNILLYGGVGYLINPKLAGVAGGSILLKRAMSNPRLQRMLSTRLRLMADGEYKILEGAIKSKKWNQRAGRIYRQLKRDMEKIAQISPELRVTGIIKQQTTATIGGTP
jgi:hypothetical protein